VFNAAIPASDREAQYKMWKRAVERSKAWETPDK
jgi:glycerol kinase